MATPVTIRVSNDDVQQTKISGLVIQFYTTLGVFVTSGTTDADGEVDVLLNDADYDLLFYKQGVTILPKQPQRITVDEDLSNIFLVTGHVRTMPESIDPKLCKVSGHLIGGDGRPIVNIKLAAIPVSLISVIDNKLVAPESMIRFQSDTQGYFEFDLIRSMKYSAYLDGRRGKAGQLDLIVPNQASIAIDKLLFPLPINASFTAANISLPHGGAPDDSIGATILYTDGSNRYTAPDWVRVKVATTDELVATAVITADGKLAITPLSKIGNTTLTITRTLADEVLWSPVPAFTTGSVVVTVT